METGYRSYVGDVPASPGRTKEIDEKLAELAAKTEGTLSFSEIAEYCGMSKQAVYQIEKKALRKIAVKYPELREELYGAYMG